MRASPPDPASLEHKIEELTKELARARGELGEARDQQAATGHILSVISSLPMDLPGVFAKVASSAARLCDAYDAAIAQVDGDVLRFVAHEGPIPVVGPVPIARGVLMGRAVIEREIIHVADLQAEAAEYPEGSEYAQRLGHRTMLAVPLNRAGEAIGVIALRRMEKRPFSDSQIALLKTFADQAVLAIESARLFEEAQARTKEVQESLEYQMATSDVLNVISSSPNELQPVLDTILDTARRLCHSDVAQFFLLDNGRYRLAAHKGSSLESVFLENPISPETVTPSITGKAARERRTIHVPDVAADTELAGWLLERKAKGKSILAVPLIRGEVAIGVITLVQTSVRPFTERQIELVSTFAAQAVIAINNVDLFAEVQARTAELTDTLERQTATSEVLSVISRSPTQLQPVLDAIAGTAARLCRTDFTYIVRLEGDCLRLVATNNADAEHARFVARNPQRLDRGSLAGRVALEHRTIHVPDVLEDPEYTRWDSQRLGGQRSMLGVPLLRESETIGVILLLRTAVEPFTEKEMDIVTTFADQAVIAIENTRLFQEVQARTRDVQESLEYQTAISDVLSVISKSPHALQPVLDAIMTTAARLCQGTHAHIRLLREDGAFHIAANQISD